MPGLDGFETLKALPPDLPLPLIIFVTGFHEHAMAAFEANAIAYLLKPIEPERLPEMVERAWRLQHFAEDRAEAVNQVHQFTANVPRNFARLWPVNWTASYCWIRLRSFIFTWTTALCEPGPATTTSGLTINWVIWSRG
jgi:DNA-binding LytR/AlgR family response regulator